MTTQQLPTALSERADERQPQPRMALQGDVLAYQTVIGLHLAPIPKQRELLGFQRTSLARHGLSAEGLSR